MSALLRTEGVRKAYGGVHALDSCTVEIDEGSVAGLIGPNGSGKTTLFNVITGYAKADGGQVYLADKKITNVAPDKVFALGIGRTFQLTRIFASLTVLENMLVASKHGGAAARKHAMEQLEFVGIAGHHAALAGTLSYGQRKLLELAYVLVSDPAVILLDEPAGGVNLSLVNHIADRIRELNAAGKTFLIVEHNMEFVMGLCDRVTVLDSGAVVAAGPPAIIRTDRRVLNAYLGEDLEDDDPQPGGAGMTAPVGGPAARGGHGGEAGASTTARSVLKIEDLVAGYGGGDVLRGVALEVAEGGITCVVGPNGAGKSTLMSAISGLLRPRLGSITLDGKNLVGMSPRQILRLGVVQVPQNHSLFRDMTVRENIELGAYILSDRALTARRVKAVFDIFPDIAGWEGKKAGSLSGGQQRLVEFARALMLEPRLLMLDEPSMGLAPKILRTVFNAIRQMNSAGTTILLVEQNARAGLRLSSHGVVMESGRVRLSGTGREVLENPEIGALYLGGAVSAG